MAVTCLRDGKNRTMNQTLYTTWRDHVVPCLRKIAWSIKGVLGSQLDSMLSLFTEFIHVQLTMHKSERVTILSQHQRKRTLRTTDKLPTSLANFATSPQIEYMTL